MWEIVLTEVLDVSALQIRMWFLTALSVPLLRPCQQEDLLDLQAYQETASGTGSHLERALLVQLDTEILRLCTICYKNIVSTRDQINKTFYVLRLLGKVFLCLNWLLFQSSDAGFCQCYRRIMNHSLISSNLTCNSLEGFNVDCDKLIIVF